MALSPYDLFDVRSLLSEEERAVQDAVARFTDEKVIPVIGEAFDQGRFPKELVAEVAALGLLGSSLPEEYGCAGLNAVSYGLICQELERGDSGLRSFVSVQSSLCMYPIYAYGSEEQRAGHGRAQRHLVLDLLGSEAGHALLQQEALDAVLGLRPDDCDVSQVAVGDPHLGTVQDVTVALFLGLELHRDDVGTGARL